MPVTIDEVESRVEEAPPTTEAASAKTKTMQAVDPEQLKKVYTAIKERELRLRAD
jgi:hypothetical protein